jgi:tetratricopeptide (TPR) repeat protein
MQNPFSLARRTWASLVILLALTVTSAVPAALAQSEAQAGEAREQETGSTELSKQEQKERAKQARIEEYLRKKEERRARKELDRQQKQVEQAEVAAAAATGSEAAAKVGTREEQIVLPRQLAETQAILRQNPIAEDPTVATYLDLIDRAEASPQQLAAFGNFLAQNGMNRLALVYYGTALSIEQDDPLLWLNVGTLHRQIQEYSPAASAYARALNLDPNLAFAHYNLGAVYDEMGKYEAALEEYRIALTLDPSLGDPETNPQAANNERLLAVKLMLYQEQIGNLGLPLVEVPGGELATLDDDADTE